MAMILHNLVKTKTISPPGFLPDNTHYLTIMGSQAYGVATEDSDFDVYGWCIPPKTFIFPHLAGVIHGFGSQGPRFEQWQQHHVYSENREYDFTVYGIVKFFQLVMENNPNMVDSLFTPTNCVIHSTRLGNLVRDNRKKFLHRGCWHKFKGYAYSMLHKAKSQTRIGTRAEGVAKYGYDLKFAANCVRLINEVEQILTEGDLDLRRCSEQIKSVRRGDWTIAHLEEWFASKERSLETQYAESKLPYSPDEDGLKALLMAVLEEHYGDLSTAVASTGMEKLVLSKIAEIVRPWM
jgi:predicted nucleotidyltransferase